MTTFRLLGVVAAALVVLAPPAPTPASAADTADCSTYHSSRTPSKLTLECGSPGPEFPYMKQEVERTTPFMTPALQKVHSCGEITQRQSFLYFEARDKCKAVAHYLAVHGDFRH
ncbi:hypothetical protein AB0A70_34200 [Streptomyces morookaense]|uniref:hypothetical protein n=1 Tax=Streptomyces TaxID=1883 RepID=UPI001D106901|nr:hypothetical protein [Streptomyces sp. ET3-23]MCC2275285.1 hypothetical protein [Streptomyces sp. ET3-23]